MSNSRNAFTSLLHRLGVVGPAGVCAFGGSGASKTSRGSGAPTGLIFATFATALAALAFSAAPALAAAPETPGLRVESITASTATFYGVLNPNAAGVAGTYEFLYKVSKTGACEGESHAPASPGISFGLQHEELPAEAVSGLKANTEYAVCLLAETSPTEKTLSAPITFTIAPEPPETLSPAKSITAKTAILEGVLNPKAAAAVNAGWYFAYSTEAKCTENALTNPAEPEALIKAQTESKEVTELQPNKKYEFCLVAFNDGGGQSTAGNEVSLMTEPAAPEVSGESASFITTSGARLNAAVNPNNEQTTYFFEYSSVSEAEVLASKGTKVPVAPPAALENYGFQGISVPTGVLHADTTYYYRVVAENAQSAKEHKPAEGAVEHFETAPEAPEGLKAEPITTSTAELNGELDPKATQAGDPETYEFVYRQSIAGCLGPGEATTMLEGAAGGMAEAAKPAELTGLPPGETYAFCLRVRNEAGVEALSAPVTFTTLAVAPTIEAGSEFATEVASTSATLDAKINPGGAETGYRVEYVTEAQFQAHGYTEASDAPASEADAGPGHGVVPAVVHVQGLIPSTAYHYRFAAGNAVQRGVQGEDRTFTTRPSATGFSLPDGREWEMVSPPDKYAGQINPIARAGNGGGSIQAAEDGGAITYNTTDPIDGEPPGQRGGLEPSQELATRGPDGWSDEDITTPNEHVSGLYISNGGEYRLFSSDLSLGVVEPTNATPLAPAVLPGEAQDEKTLWLRDDSSGGYLKLASAANTLPGTKISLTEEEEEILNRGGYYPVFAGASPDLSHVVFEDEYSSLETKPIVAGSGPGVFEWSGGRLAYVGPGVLGGGNVVRHAISDDGSRAIYSNDNGLYLTDMERKETILIAGHVGIEEGHFQTASADGSKVFFTDGGPLVAGSSASTSERTSDLYVFEETEASRDGGPLAGTLTDLTLDSGFATDAEDRAAVQGQIIGASEDGSYVYFVANGVLGDAGEHGVSQEGKCGENESIYLPTGNTCYLYVEHYDGGDWEAPEFIATLSGEDRGDWSGHSGSDLSGLTARVSPNGRWLAFMSDRSLTGYDNVDVNEQPTQEEEGSGVTAGTKVEHHDEEVYLFDQATGRLVCAPCNPTGQRPEGVLEESEGETKPFHKLLVEEKENWGARWLAGSVPGWTPLAVGRAVYQSRYLSNNGRLFFDSPDALVPADVNHLENVYELEPEGVGNCQAGVADASEVYEPATDGCVGLISSGTSSDESAFLDASEGGGEVFFLTASQLVPQDEDQAFDIYDAHECTASSPCTSQAAAAVPPACTSEASCKVAPEAQPSIYGLPSSATFKGESNLAPVPPAVVKKVATKKTVKCKKGLVKNKKGMCVKKSKPRKKAKKASDDRRASR
jgi:hypothetical protein